MKQSKEIHTVAFLEEDDHFPGDLAKTIIKRARRRRNNRIAGSMALLLTLTLPPLAYIQIQSNETLAGIFSMIGIEEAQEKRGLYRAGLSDFIVERSEISWEDSSDFIDDALSYR